MDMELIDALLFKNREEWRAWLEKNHMIVNEV
jgi:Fe-S cluster biosynthesis and repair protein YggX